MSKLFMLVALVVFSAAPAMADNHGEGEKAKPAVEQQTEAAAESEAVTEEEDKYKKKVIEKTEEEAQGVNPEGLSETPSEAIQE